MTCDRIGLDISAILSASIALLTLVGCTSNESMTGIELTIEPDGTRATEYAQIAATLRTIGVGVWPLALVDVPNDIRSLLDQDGLSQAETEKLRDHFLLDRARLLELVADSGRRPNVPNGGALETTVANQDYGYPQLWVVRDNVDYTRFDRFHVNVADDGTGVDEVLQMLSGEGVVVRSEQPDGTIYNLRLGCSPDACWIFSYDAGSSHIGSLSSATPGTKLVVQAFGPPVWSLRYTDE